MPKILSPSLLLLVFPALAGAEPTHIAIPAEPPVVETRTLEEVWRLDNETDPDLPLMGVIAMADVADDGHVFLLDRQLAQVLEIAPDGTYVRTLGRAGEGPGELAQPIMIQLLPGGPIALAQVFPGKVVYLNRDGTPAAEAIRFRGSNPILLRIRQIGERRVAVLRTMAFSDGGVRRNEFRLQACGEEGEALRVYREGTWTVRSDPPTVSEQGSWFPSATWDLAADGTLVLAPRRDEYRLEWIAPDGETLRVVTRPFTPCERTKEEREEFADGMRFRGADGHRETKTTVLDTEPVFRGVQILDDGTIWVRTCFAERNLPDGVAIRYDVFSTDGEFLKEVRIAGDFDRETDYWGLLRDGTFLHYVNAASALDAMYAAVEDRETDPGSAARGADCLVVRRLRPLR